MTYNTTSRRRFSKAQREAFLLLHKSTCYWCLQPILDGQEWDIEHQICRELLAGKDADRDENLKPIHRKECHPQKTATDRKLIAKSNHVRAFHGTDGKGGKQTGKGWSTGKRSKWKKKLDGSVIPR